MLDPPRVTPVEQPEDKAGRQRYGDEQRMRREHTAVTAGMNQPPPFGANP